MVGNDKTISTSPTPFPHFTNLPSSNLLFIIPNNPPPLLNIFSLSSFLGMAKSYTLGEVSQHNNRHDCWLLIGGKVSLYLSPQCTICFLSLVHATLFYLDFAELDPVRFTCWIWAYMQFSSFLKFYGLLVYLLLFYGLINSFYHVHNMMEHCI